MRGTPGAGAGASASQEGRRVREARLHLQDRAPHPVRRSALAQITILEGFLEDERRRAFQGLRREAIVF